MTRYLIALLVIFVLYCPVVAQENEKYIIIDSLQIHGNNRTHDRIILNELTFGLHDTLSTSQLKQKIIQSRNNLLKLPLFNFVDISYNIVGAYAQIDILPEERWFFWPALSITNPDRNFNEWVKQKDYTRVDYTFGLKKYNFRGMNESIKLYFTFGYSLQMLLIYDGIYFDKKRKHGLKLTYGALRKHSLEYTSNQNQLQTIQLENAIEYRRFIIQYKFRPCLTCKHELEMSYNQLTVHDSIVLLNPDFIENGNTKSSFFAINYKMNIDQRDASSYPLTGHAYSLSVYQRGLNRDSFHLTKLQSSLSVYLQLNSLFYYSGMLSAISYPSKVESFYYKKGLGYEINLRGFEYYTITGKHHASLQQTLKAVVIPTRVIYLLFLPFNKFNKLHFSMYLNVYGDLGYVEDKRNLYQSDLSNQLLYSGGVGIDFVTYYDKVLRLEYSFNKKMEQGLFVHFKAAF